MGIRFVWLDTSCSTTGAGRNGRLSSVLWLCLHVCVCVSGDQMLHHRGRQG